MSDEYRNYLKMSEVEKAKVEVPPFCAESYLDYKKSKKDKEILKATVSQSRYNAYEEGLVTDAKNQHRTGSCWTFAATSLIETAAIIKGYGKYDFSERHVEYSSTYAPYLDGYVNPLGFNRVLDTGGNPIYASSYYYRGAGPILETSMPFQYSNNLIYRNEMPDDKAVLLLDDFNYSYNTNSLCDEAGILDIKERVLKYGSVGLSIYHGEDYLKSARYYYYDGDSPTNHAVTIVGWDDSISASSFNNNPGRNGAFIIKNSWGQNLGDRGFMYISYSDSKLCGRTYTYSGVEKNDYSNVYYSAQALSNSGLTVNTAANMYEAVKFTKKSSDYEVLDRISFEVSNGVNYQIYYSFDDNKADSSKWVKVSDYLSDATGVKTIRFNPVLVSKDYYVIIKMNGSGGYVYPLMCKSKVNDEYYKFDVTPGTSFYGTNLNSLIDTTTLTNNYSDGCSNVVYAYTKSLSDYGTNVVINSITPNKTKVYSMSDGYFDVDITSENIFDYNQVNVSIVNSSNENKTNLFNVTGSVQNNDLRIYVNSNFIPEGTYKLIVSYLGITSEKEFTIYADLKSNKYTINNTSIVTNFGSKTNLSIKEFVDNLIYTGPLKIYDKNNNELKDFTKTDVYVGTGSYIIFDDRRLDVVLIGDVYADGLIDYRDYMKIRNHLLNPSSPVITDKQELLASDYYSDNNVDYRDYMKIRNFLLTGK